MKIFGRASWTKFKLWTRARLNTSAGDPSASGTCLHPYDDKHVVPDSADRRYECRCHERMGNDFWFLPTGRCLWDAK